MVVPGRGRSAPRDGPVLRGVVLATGPTGLMVGFGGRHFLLEGAPRLPIGMPVTLRTSAETASGGGGPTTGWLVGTGGTAAGRPVPIRLSPAPDPAADPAVLPSRSGPVLPATLSLGGEGGVGAVGVRVALTPPPPGPPPQPPSSDPPDLAWAVATLATLAGGPPVAAVVLPRRTGGGVALALDGGAVLHVRDLAIGVPEGGIVGVRVVDVAEAAEGTSPPATSSTNDDGAPTGDLRLLPADARLGAALLALADETGPARDTATPPPSSPPEQRQEAASPTSHALLGEPERPYVLGLARERDGGRSPDDDEAGGRLVIETTFDRLGRVRLEVDRPGGELRLVVRAEQPLPGPARAELLDLAGAAFELGGARAQLLVATGGLPPPPATIGPAMLA